MNIRSNVVYIFGESGRSDVVKIGTCSKGGWERFREGAFMNPRGLEIIAMWRVPDTKEASQKERAAHKLFRRLDGADGREWFYAEPSVAVAHLSALFGGCPTYDSENLPFSPEELYTTDCYDELSERGDRYKGRLVQRRIWIHAEAAGQFTKISQNTWWCEPGSRSTNAKRVTYNTSRLTPVACFAISVEEFDPQWDQAVESANIHTLRSWQDAVAKYGVHNSPAGRVGWTHETPESLADEFQSIGFERLLMDPNRPPRGVKSLKHPFR